MKPCQCVLFALSGLLLAVACRSGPPENVRVSNGPHPLVEATIAAHPGDAQRLVVTASELVPDRGSRPRAFVSSDGGRTWRSPLLPDIDARARDGRLSHAFNNWLAFSPTGRAYLSTLTSNGQRKEVLVYSSPDGGESWQGPAVVPSGGLDFPTMSATVHGGRERLYLTATGLGRTNRHLTDAPDEQKVFPVFVSQDGGRTFSALSVVHGPLASEGRRIGAQAMNIVAAPDGAGLTLPFLQYGFGKGEGAILLLARSEDVGAHFSAPQPVLSRQPGPPNGATLAVDAAGDAWYAAWTTIQDGYERVVVARSSGDLTAWTSARIEISPGRPHYPAVAVAPDGAVAVAWLQADRERGGACTRVGFARSSDRGVTFTPPRWLSLVACADAKLNQDWPVIPTAPGGEYMGITAAADGAFHVVWADGRAGPYQLYTARVGR